MFPMTMRDKFHWWWLGFSSALTICAPVEPIRFGSPADDLLALSSDFGMVGGDVRVVLRERGFGA